MATNCVWRSRQWNAWHVSKSPQPFLGSHWLSSPTRFPSREQRPKYVETGNWKLRSPFSLPVFGWVWDCCKLSEPISRFENHLLSKNPISSAWLLDKLRLTYHLSQRRNHWNLHEVVSRHVLVCLGFLLCFWWWWYFCFSFLRQGIILYSSKFVVPLPQLPGC